MGTERRFGTLKYSWSSPPWAWGHSQRLCCFKGVKNCVVVWITSNSTDFSVSIPLLRFCLLPIFFFCLTPSLFIHPHLSFTFTLFSSFLSLPLFPYLSLFSFSFPLPHHLKIVLLFNFFQCTWITYCGIEQRCFLYSFRRKPFPWNLFLLFK